MKKLILIASIAAVLTGTATTVHAGLVYGLSTANSIFSFDSATPGTVSGVTAISGIATGSIVDIDFSPVALTLYGIASNGDLYRINTTTGVATLSIGVGLQLPANTITTPTVMDFNPAADRIRIFQGNSNFRLTGDAATYDSVQTAGTVSTDGTFSGVAGANLVAAAYNNNVNGTAATTLYSLDSVSDRLIIHSGTPQFSTIANATAGTLGVDIGATNVGFDIFSVSDAYVSNGDDFYTLNLGTGALTSVGTIGNGALTTKSIAATLIPEPTTITFGLALLGLGMTRVRRMA